MKKKDLLDFISRVESKAISSVAKKWDVLIAEAKVKAIEPYMDRIRQYQSEINTISEKLSSLVMLISEDIEVAYIKGAYYGVEKRINHLCGDKLIQAIQENAQYKGEVAKLKNAKNKEISEVRAEYDNLYNYCKEIRSALEINRYLIELGFDTSALAKKSTGLVVELDKSKLFVCGDNK